MDAVTRLFMNDIGSAITTAREAIDVAVRIGHRRAELLGHIVAYEMLVELADENACRPHLARAQALASQLGAVRFEAENLLGLGRLARHAGRRDEARDLLRRAMDIAIETGVGYMGPSILAELAMVLDDPEERRRVLDEGVAMLARGSVSHNHFYFHREAIEAALDMADWSAAEHYADGLEDYAAPEPLPWSTLFTTRGRLLARHGRGECSEELCEALARTLETCRRAGLNCYTARIEAALGSKF
jgi:hypothetical protein